MRRSAPALLALALWLAPSAQAELFDRVDAVVDDQLVLDSEVRLEAELAPLDADALPIWSPSRSTPLERLIDGAVLRVAAAGVALYTPSDDAVRERREAVRQQFPDRQEWNEFLARNGLDEDALELVLRRRMVAERYLTRNLQIGQSDPGWLPAAEAMLKALRGRTPIRTIPAERAPVDAGG